MPHGNYLKIEVKPELVPTSDPDQKDRKYQSEESRPLDRPGQSRLSKPEQTMTGTQNGESKTQDSGTNR